MQNLRNFKRKTGSKAIQSKKECGLSKKLLFLNDSPFKVEFDTNLFAYRHPAHLKAGVPSNEYWGFSFYPTTGSDLKEFQWKDNDIEELNFSIEEPMNDDDTESQSSPEIASRKLCDEVLDITEEPSQQYNSEDISNMGTSNIEERPIIGMYNQFINTTHEINSDLKVSGSRLIGTIKLMPSPLSRQIKEILEKEARKQHNIPTYDHYQLTTDEKKKISETVTKILKNFWKQYMDKFCDYLLKNNSDYLQENKEIKGKLKDKTSIKKFNEYLKNGIEVASGRILDITMDFLRFLIKFDINELKTTGSEEIKQYCYMIKAWTFKQLGDQISLKLIEARCMPSFTLQVKECWPDTIISLV